MDTPETPKATRWRRKRWWAAGVALWLALPVLYAAGFGPAVYARARRWISTDALFAVYGPAFDLEDVLGQTSPVGQAVNRYKWWWMRLAAEHNNFPPID